jgi:hypothetical protein
MPKWILYPYVCNVFIFTIFTLRSVYWGFKFLFAIRSKEPQKAQEYGISPDVFFVGTRLGSAVFSKDKCKVQEVEDLRNKAKSSSILSMIFFIPMPLFFVYLTIRFFF